ncbi:peroxiredoxin [Shimia marina]|uniref:Glutathione-dependent peroxiredoxin n=1 Tax=Shimia marina TaxID=321267 RepID=A0A0P1EL46_9RHOB|nr:peroxiredoxin [Shimia marina]CUH51014.1 Putative peroxiredoxin [Shimia marina]SFD60330.1 thiol peroxidase (atypical 2-Cys peroxiredoxin) [Shimia marina]
MTISVGDTLPAGTLMKVGENGPEPVSIESLSKGKKIVLFGLPGAFTSTCSSAHLPSFMRTAEAFKDKGVEDIICLSVNDPFVMDAWDKDTKASEAGVSLLADPNGDVTVAMGLEFNVPEIGFNNRSQRYSALIEDGVVKVLNLEESPGACEISAGETLLNAM